MSWRRERLGHSGRARLRRGSRLFHRLDDLGLGFGHWLLATVAIPQLIQFSQNVHLEAGAQVLDMTGDVQVGVLNLQAVELSDCCLVLVGALAQPAHDISHLLQVQRFSSLHWQNLAGRRRALGIDDGGVVCRRGPSLHELVANSHQHGLFPNASEMEHPGDFHWTAHAVQQRQDLPYRIVHGGSARLLREVCVHRGKRGWQRNGRQGTLWRRDAHLGPEEPLYQGQELLGKRVVFGRSKAVDQGA
mmetsp:Transcript_14952/g.56780  ORF Transcript_14952/g.56780 Transcript_14952/m.56780 type:complete len:246 (+) Transcript_14952:543-1280(+)